MSLPGRPEGDLRSRAHDGTPMPPGPPRRWRLTGPDGQPVDSDQPGTLGGHRRSRIYGRLDCRAARQAIARGGYVACRVFFRDEGDARAAGYRPCAVCMPQQYALWKAQRGSVTP